MSFATDDLVFVSFVQAAMDVGITAVFWAWGCG